MGSDLTSRGTMLFGRDDALERVLRVVGAAQDGVLQTCVVEGDAGVGKSALVRAVIGGVEGWGVRTFVGRGDDLERNRPLRAIAEALGSAGAGGAEALTVVPSGREWSSGELMFETAEAAASVLEGAALAAPVLLVLDDFQWVDEATVVCLRDLLRRLADLPVAVVLVTRPRPRSAVFERLFDELVRAGSPVLRLDPLDVESVKQLAAARVGAKVSEQLLRVLDRAGGNPFYVEELLAALLADGSVSIDRGQAELAGAAVATELRQPLARHLGILPAEAMNVLRIGSVLGSSFEPADLAIVTGRSVIELLPALQPAIESGLLVDAGRRLAFTHDLLRDAVYESVPTAVRAALHLDVAAALHAAGAAPVDLAPHLVQSTRAGDRRAIGLLVEVAHTAADPATTIELAEHALRLLPRDSPERDPLIARLAAALNDVSRCDDAERLAREVLARPHDPALDRSLYPTLWDSMYGRGRLQDLLRETKDVVFDDPELRHRCESVRIESLLLQGRGDRAAAIARARLPDTDSAEAIAISETAMAWEAGMRGDTAAAALHADRSIAARAQCAEFRHPVHPSQAICLAAADRFDDARNELLLGYGLAAERGVFAPRPQFHWVLSQVALFGGDLDGAQVEAETGLALIADGSGSALGVLFPHSVLALVALYRDDLDAAGRHLGDGDAVFEALGPAPGFDFYWWAKAMFHEVTGDPAGATVALASAWRLTEQWRYFLTWREIAPMLVRLAVEIGDPDLAAEVTAEAEEGARRAGGLASAEGTALRCRGLATGDGALLTAAADLLGRSPRRIDHALALLESGRALAASDRTAAVEQLRSSALALSAANAPGVVKLVDRELRSLGVGTVKASARPVTGWASLTPAEERVAALVAEGLTNAEVAARLFLSRHTVVTHVRHVLAKLGMRSRVELAASYARRAAGSGPK